MDVKSRGIFVAGMLTAGLAAITLAGCGGGGGGAGGGGSAPPPSVQLPRAVTARWTVLVFMNAANNLEPFSVENMDQMEQAPYNPDVNIVAQWKRFHEQGNTSDSAFDSAAPVWDGTRRFWIRNRGGRGGFQNDQIQDLGSVDMGDWHTLQSFVQWGKTNFPAQHYLLVVWNHGAGWEHRTVGAPAIHRGVSYDDQTLDSIETWQLPEALQPIAPLDLIAVDCSLMQMSEVVYELRNATKYVCGSEDSPPGDGYPYQQWLTPLTADPSMDAASIGRKILETDVNFYLNNHDSSGASDSVQQSLVDTGALGQLATALNTLGTVLDGNRTAFASPFAAARDAAHKYAIESGATTFYPEYKDLVEYVQLLKQDAGAAPGLNAAADGVISAVSAAVVENQGIRGDSFSHGLSIYVPVSPRPGVFAPQSYDPLYQNLDLARDAPAWNKWLQDQTA